MVNQLLGAGVLVLLLSACGGGDGGDEVVSPEVLQCRANLEAQRSQPNMVANSYNVIFKPSTPSQPSPVWPPVKPPLGIPSSGQSNEQLAAELGIRGTVRYIYDTINAANLQIDANEAARLCADPRVSSIQQDRIATLF
ncbi:hypothetical protein [Ramlibacter albus]|uniref:Uncharacterized protein n=1 Tax=Ramlibacter albus TaxID=2079448 RepID=A0A923MFR6_9BURK|nr:hypothetical protein [Ramlibacter albus]MBC5768733.1 hypothetical protein [Ramlibacter albus]